MGQVCDGSEGTGGVAGDGAAVLVVRIWWERHETPSLRARITSLLDVGRSDEHTVATTDQQEILAEVRRWVEACVARRA